MEIRPRLETIERTKDIIRNHSGKYSTYQLWRKLPKKLMYQSHKTIISHLLRQNEIVIAESGKIIYIEKQKNRFSDTDRNAILYNLSKYGYDLIPVKSIKKAKILPIEELIIQILIKFPEARFTEAIPTLVIKNRIDKFELYRKAIDYSLINKIGLMLEIALIIAGKTRRDIGYLKDLLGNLKSKKEKSISRLSSLKDKDLPGIAAPGILKKWNLRGRYRIADFYKEEYL